MKSPLQPVMPARVSLADRLLDWRSRFSFGRVEAAVLAIYVALLALTIPFHEPWADEAQAWVIARDNSVWQILRYRLHYEGSPALWHLVLHTYQALGGRYGGIDWLGASFATAGVVIFLRWAPFPLLIRLLLPFTFFLQYQYAVIARGYTLFPLLAFTLCALFYSRQNPLWFALVAGLLANVSLQGSVFSFCLLGLFLLHRFHLARAERVSAGWTLLRPAVLYLCLLLMAALVAMPAPDCEIANGGQLTTGTVHDLLMHFPGPLPATEYLPQPGPVPVNLEAPAVLGVPPQAPLMPPPSPLARPRLFATPGAWAAWYISHDEVNPQGIPKPRPFTQPLLLVVVEVLSLATAPLSTSRLLACAFLLTLFVWLARRRSLRMLLPWAVNIAVGEALWIADHHSGLLLLALLTAIWLTVEAPPSLTQPPVSRPLDRTLIVLLAVICALQIVWTGVTLRHEIRGKYDPGQETAAYLLQHPHKRMAAFDFFAVGVQPYFPRNPFFNLPRSYWIWSPDQNPNGAHFATIEQHPDLVLFSQDMLARGFMHNEWAPLSPDTASTQDRDLPYNPIVYDLHAHGYRETHRFCGDRFMRLGASYRSCDLIFEPATEP